MKITTLLILTSLIFSIWSLFYLSSVNKVRAEQWTNIYSEKND